METKILELVDSFIKDAEFMVGIAEKENNSVLRHAWDVRLQQSELIKAEIEATLKNE